MSMTCRLLSTGALLAVALPLAACSSGASEDGTPTAGTLDVVATFYPLQMVAERVGGDAVTVTSLTPAGAEPHDLELSPAQVRSLGRAGVVVTLSGFQPSVDEALASTSPAVVVDAATVADLAATGGDEPAGTTDPHFWLDPTKLAAVAEDVAAGLAQARPDEAEAFHERADALAADLTELDDELATGLATCESRLVVTTHAAFGYLADRYGLEQVSISGLDPEQEPSPARLREVADIVENRAVTTIFAETLVSPKVAEVLADDIGVQTAVLDPVEGLTNPDSDYFSVMRDNLQALRTALRCA